MCNPEEVCFDGKSVFEINFHSNYVETKVCSFVAFNGDPYGFKDNNKNKLVFLNYCSKILAFDAAFLKEIKYFWKHNSISENIINGFTMMSLWDMTSKTIIWFIHWFTKPTFFVDVQSSSNFLIRNVSFGEFSKFFWRNEIGYSSYAYAIDEKCF